MHDTESVNSSISIDDFFQNANCLSFWNGLASLYHFGEVSAITELGDDAGMGFEGDDLVKFDYVLEVTKESEYFHLVIE